MSASVLGAAGCCSDGMLAGEELPDAFGPERDDVLWDDRDGSLLLDLQVQFELPTYRILGIRTVTV